VVENLWCLIWIKYADLVGSEKGSQALSEDYVWEGAVCIKTATTFHGQGQARLRRGHACLALDESPWRCTVTKDDRKRKLSRNSARTSKVAGLSNAHHQTAGQMACPGGEENPAWSGLMKTPRRERFHYSLLRLLF